ncbi:MAG TPA: hypothetical protein VM052_01085, partial [Candidatus Limnocylindrales bacterium]|nr:hypothetical protein [Candidatus Limnocylindrales bacterium]
MSDDSHTLTEDAELSEAQWTSLWSWESLRYRGSGWWLDAMLPRSPLGVTLVAIGLPLAWVASGCAITPDR